jgi:hypothetical protein
MGIPFPDVGSVHLRAARRDPQLMGDQLRRAWELWLGAELSAGPVLIVLEDLHWGDAPTVKLIDGALRTLSEAPLMVLGLARPEVHEVFPSLWAARGLEEIHLRELSRGACERLARAILGETSPAAVQRVAAHAQGNPFYLEELVRSLAEGRADDFPESVMAMVDTRFARLGPEARQALRAASAFGEIFWDAGVARLLGARSPAGLAPLLAELVDLEWILPVEESRFLGRREMTFSHILLREAAYATLTEEDRRTAHGLAGEWLQDEGEPNPLTLADHFERAGLLERAAFQLGRAAEHALDGNDFAAALVNAERAAGLGAEGAALGRLRLLVAEAHAWRSEHTEAEPMARAAMQLLARGSDGWANAVHQAAWAASVLGKLDELVALADELAVALRQSPSPTLLTATCVVAIKLIERGRRS